jgi:adenylate cyclase
MAVQRRLAAILAADVAGYSRLMGEDEEGTLATLTSHLTELIEPCIAEHRGRVVKKTGDGLMAEFASVVDAVRCAVAFQEGMAERNGGTPEEGRMEFRIGVNLGDVIVQDDDVYGDGVNVAARLEGLAEPGGVVISGMVHEAVRAKLDFRFDDLGSREAKNIAEPVHAFSVGMAKAAVSTSEPEPPTLQPLPIRPSIAVLPFDNMSGDPEQEYFADGMVEEIITGLACIRWLTVIARNSTFAYKGTAPDVRKVGEDLKVRYVLEGSVRKAGGRVRITAQLVEAETGGHLWADRFDGSLADLFELQDQITAGVVAAIEPSVRRAEIERAKRKRPDNLDAYGLYLRAFEHAYTFTPDGREAALSLLDAAIALDPGYAEAHGVAAWCLQQRYRWGGTRTIRQGGGARPRGGRGNSADGRRHHPRLCSLHDELSRRQSRHGTRDGRASTRAELEFRFGAQRRWGDQQ